MTSLALLVCVLMLDARSIDPRIVIERFASEPDLVTPVGVDVDSQGRVLVIESHTHFRPENYPGPKADRIKRFSDTNGDGKADRIEVIHEGSVYTMGLELESDTSLLVATRSEIFRLREVTAGKPFERQATLARLVTAGNYPHNGLSGFAIDAYGNIYFGMGENLGADYQLIGGDGVKLAGGGEGGNIFRCRPDGSKLERVATGFWNPFHLAIDAFGRMFAVDNDPDSRPPCRLLEIVESGDYGYRFRNGRKGIHPFTSWNGELPGMLPMVAGTGEAPSGIVAYERDCLAPVGCGDLLVTSWGDHRIERYSLARQGASFRSRAEPIIIGGEDFRPVGLAVAPDGSLFASDWVDRSYTLHGKGRLWRIRAASPPKAEQPLSVAMQDRQRAQALRARLADPKQVETAANEARRDPLDLIRALGIRHAPTKTIDPLVIARDEASPLARSEALRRIDRTEDLQELWKAAESDDPFLMLSARVGLTRCLGHGGLIKLAREPIENPARRLAVLLSLREMPEFPELDGVLKPFLTDADSRVRFAAIQWVGEARRTALREALVQSVSSSTITKTLFEGTLAALERLDGVNLALAQEISGQDYLADWLSKPETPPLLQARALRAIRPDHPTLTIDRLTQALGSHQMLLRLEAVRSLRESPLPAARPLLVKLAQDAKAPSPIRAEAVLGLSADDGGTRETLMHLAKDRDPAVAREAARFLTSNSGNSSSPIDPSENRPPTNDLEAWLSRLDGPADAEAGQRLFFHPRGPGCARCHSMDGRGGRVGPDLSNISAMLDRRRLLESILQPSKEIAPQFVSWAVARNDGTLFTGVLLEQNADGSLVYGDANNVLIRLQKSDIADRKPQTTSIMPAELVNMMSLRDLRDLLTYLQNPRSVP